MQIRRYRVGEESQIWDVVFSSTRVSNARDYHPDLIDRWAPHNKDMQEWAQRITKKNPFVAIIDSEVVGMAELEESGFIDYFYVHPRFQGCGVGKALMSVIFEKAEAQNIERIFADVSVTAQTFFESQGFEVTESRSNVILGHPAPNFAMSKNMNSEQGTAPNP